MRMKFVAPLITLLSLVAGNAEEEACPAGSNRPCKCGPKFHSIVSFADPPFTRTFCGGSIINDKQVLTLAECVAGRNLGEFVVVVKLYNVDTMTVYEVESVIFHTEPFYGGRGIAIVNIVQRLDNKISNGIVCLPFCFPENRFVGYGFVAMGWYRQSSDIQRTVSGIMLGLNVNDRCISNITFPTYKYMCIDDVKPHFIEYQGGEPVYRVTGDNRQIQIGIIVPRSFCNDYRPMAILQIGQFAEWIKSQAPKGFSYCKTQ